MSSTNSSSNIFPPLDPTSYQWERLPSDSGWKRPALAGEIMWFHRPSEYHQMFISASLTMIPMITSTVFYNAARVSWLRLRYETPDLGVTATQDNGKVYMNAYTTFNSLNEVEWCKKTLFQETTRRTYGFGELKERLSVHKANRAPEQVSLLLNSIVDDGSDIVQKVELMLNIDHQITDGIGTRILLSKYLSILAANVVYLNHPQSIVCDNNLPTTPWIRLLNDKQILSGPEYDKTVASNREVLLEKMAGNVGIRLTTTEEPGVQEHHFISVSQNRSKGILKAIKSIFGLDTNITHLGHAAMVLALLHERTRSQQSLPEEAALYSPCWMNGRRYLRSTESHPTPTRSYVPICQSFAPIIFSDLHRLALSPSATKNEIKKSLIDACRMSQQEYGLIRGRDSVMPETVALIEDLGNKMGKKAAGAPSAPELDADPFFLSDGIIESYIDHQYLLAFEVQDIKFAAHAEGPNLIVRMSSWRDQVTISGEWRSCDYEREMVERLLADMVDMMSLI